MRSVEWRYFNWPWVTPNYPIPLYFWYFVSPFISLKWLEVESLNLVGRLIVASSSQRMTNHSWKSGHVNRLNFDEHQPYFWNSWSYSGQILYTGYVKSLHTDNKWLLKGRGKGHVTHFKFWCPNWYLCNGLN